jgi:hypothetical protein
MTTISVTTPTSRVRSGLCLAAALTAALTVLSGCGAGSSTPTDPVVTVTTTPTVTAKPKAGPTASPTTSRAGAPKSDVTGRQFDLGTIVEVKKDGDWPVIIFDRWTARGVKDSTLAAEGVPIHVHSDAPYENVNSKITYRIPVAPGATFTYSHCVDVFQPPAQRSSTLDEFARLQDSDKVVLLSLDSKGRAVKAENDPGC